MSRSVRASDRVPNRRSTGTEGDIMSLARGIRISLVGIALLVIAGWGGGVGRAMPDRANSQVASGKAELPPFNLEIRTLSNRADLLSDGDALVEVQVPKTVPLKKVTLTLNGVDVGDQFVVDEGSRTLRGVLTGMAPGGNTLVADANGNGNGRPWASLTLTNHPRGGPILLGSQTQPWICATPAPVAAAGNRRRGPPPAGRRPRQGTPPPPPPPAACRPSRRTRSATSHPNTSSSTARRHSAARPGSPIPTRLRRSRPTTASSLTRRAPR